MFQSLFWVRTPSTLLFVWPARWRYFKQGELFLICVLYFHLIIPGKGCIDVIFHLTLMYCFFCVFLQGWKGCLKVFMTDSLICEEDLRRNGTLHYEHTCLFLWIVGTFYRRNGFYTVQIVFSIALTTMHLNLPLTGNFARLYFLKKTNSVWFVSLLKYRDMG